MTKQRLSMDKKDNQLIGVQIQNIQLNKGYMFIIIENQSIHSTYLLKKGDGSRHDRMK